ncbi:MAG: hypothetical protein A3A58_00270 [Candidatus Blackburnbacteria bacterium RIFCSPLOWO2_01_FULL_41_27]|uniref:Glycosyl transferase family 1 domain-containing protein n=1 Tax=Candidatus Blackburnbacteria bacterium RIFCSPLOWO2_01_FULL_41_27 TaxID=1797520 RepID=A0A1G1VB87_9BACT|nr:MAG: hypothetical protein A3A58_00270 [Candidatus Blackburnbacteria bacterium RIFCSPLOWO2_01_FULL_41_27]
MITKLNKDSKVLVATFSPWKDGQRAPTNGMVYPFVDFFPRHSKYFALLDQPHPGSDIVIPFAEVYENGKLKEKVHSSIFVSWMKPLLSFANAANTSLVFKFRDLISVVDFALGSGKKFDLFIGFESVNALAGIFLRMLGRVDTVIYYVSDFSPRRYKQKWFNNFYLFMDKLAATYADATWNVSPAMPEARKKLGYDMKKISPQLYAPNAFFRPEIKHLPLNQVKPFSIVYAGSLGPENGPGLAIEAMPKILKKFPKATLTLIGGGRKEVEEGLKDLIKKLNLEKSVDFRGFVQTNKEMLDIVRHHRISIAPYQAFPNSVRWYADAVKIRTSMACGLPVITTHIPPMGREAEKNGAGIVVKDDVRELANAVIKVFSDEKLYLKMRKNAIAAAKDNTWENSYTNALKSMGVSVNT